MNDYRLELAKQCGADVTVNTKNAEFGRAMLDAFGPDKADIIYDCAGNDITMDQAIQNARKGSTIILVAHGDCGLTWNKRITVEGGQVTVEEAQDGSGRRNAG